MKIQIYKTKHLLLEEPTRIGICHTFTPTVNKNGCSCDTKTKAEPFQVVKFDFGNYIFDCEQQVCSQRSCADILVPVRTNTAIL